jgi:environmental stress-induced protein Ves
MLQHIPQSDFLEGRWRNGQGISWEIASHKIEGAADFSWRFAKARIDNDVPFSIYPGMDRIFMMIEGGGMNLDFEGGSILQVHQAFVPHAFPCDVPLFCKLLSGPSLDLNLFTVRRTYKAECSVLELNGMEQIDLHNAEAVFYALEGSCVVSSHHGAVQLRPGDAAIAHSESIVSCVGSAAKIYVGILQKL